MLERAATSLAEQAIRLSEELNAAVFPLKADKRPLTEHGFKDAVIGEDDIYGLFARYPQAELIGVATGGASRLCVVDIDRKNGRDGFSWTGLKTLPPTLTFQTPSGGEHLYYRTPPGKALRCSQDTIYPGIDIRADGGYVAQGSPYKRTIDLSPADLSEAELAILSPRPKLDLATLFPNSPRSSDAAQRIRSIQDGSWHDNVRDTVARWVRLGMGDEEIHQISSLFTTPGYTPAETRREVQQMIDGARAKGWGPHNPVVSADRFRLYSLKELNALPEPDWLVEGLLMQETDAVLYGESEVGKSFTAISLSVAIATGAPWFGKAVKRGLVLYIAGEGGRSLLKRFNAALEKLGLDKPENIKVISDNADMFRDEDPSALIALATALKPGLIIFDTISQHSGGSTENSDDMKVVLKNMRSVARSCGATNLILAHPGKDTGRGIRGWSGQLNNVDTVIEQVRQDDEAEGRRTVTLSCKKQKDADKFAPIHLDLEEHANSLVLVEGGAPLKAKRVKLTGNTLLAYQALCEVTARSGERSASEGVWRLECAKRGLGGADDPNSQRKAFRRAYDRLIQTHIDVRSGRIALRDKTTLSGE